MMAIIIQTVQYVIVKAGDTVSSLASQYHTTISQIAKDNNLDSNYTIIVGQKLRISSDDGQNTSTDTTPTTNNTQTNSNANYQVQNSSSASQPSTTQGSVANNGSYSSPGSGNIFQQLHGSGVRDPPSLAGDGREWSYAHFLGAWDRPHGREADNH